MTILSKILFIAVFSGGAAMVKADQISGSYSNDCGSMVRLWDLSGNYSETNDIENETMTLSMDANGLISGQGHFNVTDNVDSLYLSGDFVASGSVKSAGSATRVNLVFKTASGTGTVNGYSVSFSMTLNENLELDTASRLLVGNSRGSLKLTPVGSHRSFTQRIQSGPVQAHLPDAVDGAWGLSLNASPTGAKYGGAGVVHLSNGKSFNLGLTGKYSVRSDLSTITLKGTEVRSMTLNLVGSKALDELTIRSLKGKLLGQKIQTNH